MAVRRRLLWGLEHFKDAIEVFEGLVFEDDFAFAVFVLDLDAKSEGALELLLGFADVGIEDALGFGGGGFGVHEVVDRAFELADGHGELNGAVGEAQHGFLGVEGHEGLGVSEGELGGLDHGEHFGGKLEQAQEVGDRGAVLAGALGHLLLGEAEVAGEALEGAGLLDRVEVLALEILNDGDLHRLLVGDLADDGGDGGLAGALRGEPAALAGDELEASGVLADGDGLDDSGDLDGIGELVEGDFVEVGAGLVGIAVDQLDGNVRGRISAGGLLRGCGWRGNGRLDAAGGGKKGFEAASEGFSFVVGWVHCVTSLCGWLSG